MKTKSKNETRYFDDGVKIDGDVTLGETKAKHTPGPWKFVNHGIVANADKEIPDDICLVHFCGTHCSDVGQKGKANARLIAAAPALLGACNVLMSAITRLDAGDGLHGSVMNQAKEHAIKVIDEAETKE